MTLRRLTLRGVEFFELQIRISLRKRIFQQNNYSLLTMGPEGSIHEKNAKNSRDTASLSLVLVSPGYEGGDEAEYEHGEGGDPDGRLPPISVRHQPSTERAQRKPCQTTRLFLNVKTTSNVVF